MSRYPHSNLFRHSSRIVVLTGHHIQVLNARNGHILHSTTRKDETALVNSGPIRCSGMSKDGRYLATAGDDKRLRIWDLESFTLLTSRELAKKPTSIEFARNGDILVSDKFGDVFRWTVHEDTPSGKLILGHASLLTTFLLTPDERFIITADRDEHIRVSWYPEGYVIESYCLGHKKYVSAIHIPVESPGNLISGGGDHELKVWDWMTGRLRRNISVFAAVEPFIKVVAQKRVRENDDDDNDEDTGKENLREAANEGLDVTTPVFVVRKIGSFLSGGEIHVVFSVVGATAIFEFVLMETDDQPDIRHHDFGKPVINFILCEDGLIWVLLDANFRLEDRDAPDEHPSKLVEAIQWSDDQRFVDAGDSEVLNSLNTICSLPVTADDLKALNLYADLSSLPKSTDGGQGHTESALTNELTTEGTSTGLTKRALGRLKHKHALNLLQHEKVDGISGPNTKKMKADSNEVQHNNVA